MTTTMNGGSTASMNSTHGNTSSPSNKRSSEIRSEQQEEEAAVCCGCRPRNRRYKKNGQSDEVEEKDGENIQNNVDGDGDDSSYTRASFFRIRPRKLQIRRGRRRNVRDRSDSLTTTVDRRSADALSSSSSWPFPRLRRKYFDADMGQDSEWDKAVIIDESIGAESMYFFDALEDPLGEEEYPIDMYVVKSDATGQYPIIFTTSLQHPAPHVTMDKPETMLKRKNNKTVVESSTTTTGRTRSSISRSFSFDGSVTTTSESLWVASAGTDEAGTRRSSPSSKNKLPLKHQQPGTKKGTAPLSLAERRNSEPIQSHRDPSVRFLDIQRRPSLEYTKQLEKPRVKSNLKGYPGELEMNELEECQKFLRGLRELDSAITEQVYSFRDIEEEPYTICRWLRATKFDADKILERLQENQPLFDQAKADEFYPNVEEAIGAPLSVFLSQYPFLPVGHGKNGSPVNFFLAGKINPEGILCMTTIERLQSYFWYSFMWKFKQEVRLAQEKDPDFVRLEGINIIDLNGLSSSALTGETMEVIKVASKISDFFPETLHCMLVLNAPSFFAISWGIIKKFIDPRTASRIQLFANRDKGIRALEQLVERSELPPDYGGNNISLQEAFLREASDPALIRQQVELLHCKRRKGKSELISWILEEGECMEITLYTRSASKSTITVSLNDDPIAVVEAEGSFDGGENNNGFNRDEPSQTTTMKPLPRKFIVAPSNALVGPGKVTVEAEDLDTANKSHSGMSRGYFLIVGDVKAASFQEEDQEEDSA